MKKTDFIELIGKPQLLSAKHIPALKQVAVDFPYFIHTKVLLAKALYQENHYEYDKFLKQVALTVPDREVLHDYLHDKKRAYESAAAILASPSELTVDTLIEEQEVGFTETLPEEQPSIEYVQEEVEATTLPPMDQQDFTSSDESVDLIDQTLEEHITVAPAEVITNEEAEMAISTIQPPVEEDVINEVVTEPIEPSSIPEPLPNEQHSFMEWLKLAQDKKTTVAKVTIIADEPPFVSEEKPIEQEQSQPAKPIIEVTKEDIERAVAKSNVNDFQNILDKFIKENPSISRPKAEFFNPVNMAKQSVEEDEELVTETLANLYYKQGNHKRAIRAYEKLCLIYPSKMTYFANLIQKIKSEIKD